MCIRDTGKKWHMQSSVKVLLYVLKCLLLFTFFESKSLLYNKKCKNALELRNNWVWPGDGPIPSAIVDFLRLLEGHFWCAGHCYITYIVTFVCLFVSAERHHTSQAKWELVCGGVRSNTQNQESKCFFFWLCNGLSRTSLEAVNAASRRSGCQVTIPFLAAWPTLQIGSRIYESGAKIVTLFLHLTMHRSL